MHLVSYFDDCSQSRTSYLSLMKSSDEFRKTFREICDLAFASGTRALSDDQKVRMPFALEQFEKDYFIQKCNEGFKAAQEKLVVEICSLQAELEEMKAQLKQSRQKKVRSDSEQATLNINLISRRLRILTHISDGIAWQMIGGEIHIARRLYLGEREIKKLKSSNIKMSQEVAALINLNPQDFALINDITSYVQIGDLLVKRRDRIAIMELKEGKVNEQVSAFIRNMDTPTDAESPALSESMRKQAERVKRQIERMKRATDVINSDQGLSPATGQKITVFTPKADTDKYHTELMQMHEELKSNPFSQRTVDGCLLIGMFRGDAVKKMAHKSIEMTLREYSSNYEIVDLETITYNISEPIFGKPFSPDFIIDLLTGETKVMLGLCVDSMFELFNRQGLEIRWLTAKETGKLSHRKSDWVVNGKGIQIKLPDNRAVVVGGGMPSKIFYDSIRPSCIARQYLSLNLEEFPEKSDKH
jgi:hypothetical protein